MRHLRFIFPYSLNEHISARPVKRRFSRRDTMSRQKGFWLLLVFLALLGLWGGYRAVRAGGDPAGEHVPVVQARFTSHLGFVFWQADPALSPAETGEPQVVWQAAEGAMPAQQRGGFVNTDAHSPGVMVTGLIFMGDFDRHPPQKVVLRFPNGVSLSAPARPGTALTPRPQVESATLHVDEALWAAPYLVLSLCVDTPDTRAWLPEMRLQVGDATWEMGYFALQNKKALGRSTRLCYLQVYDLSRAPLSGSGAAQSATKAFQEGAVELRLQGFHLQPYHCLSEEEAERIRQALPEAWQQGHYEKTASGEPFPWCPIAPPNGSAAQQEEWETAVHTVAEKVFVPRSARVWLIAAP